MNNEKEMPFDIHEFIKVDVSKDHLCAYIKFESIDQLENKFNKNDVYSLLDEAGIIFGIKENLIIEILKNPTTNELLKVAEGFDQTTGENAKVKYLVKKDRDYEPEFVSEENTEEKIDYKNISYYQTVKKDDVLCEIIKAKEGLPGKDVFGEIISSIKGKEANIRLGKNTLFNEDETQMLAECDGIIQFKNEIIEIKKVLQIKSSVNLMTGNIDFSGDVIINGDVCSGFSVNSGGNLTIRGVVEDAEINTKGDIIIAKGVVGNKNKHIIVGGNFRAKYIQNAIISVHGNMVTDYIVDSIIQCDNNIKLSGAKGVIIGGTIKLLGELYAKQIGNKNEEKTKIEILELKSKAEEELPNEENNLIQDEANKLKILLGKHKEFEKKALLYGELLEIDKLKIKMLLKQISKSKEKIEDYTLKEKEKEKNEDKEYNGKVICRQKLFKGVEVKFGDETFQFYSDYIEYCKIYWDKKIQQVLL